LGANTLISCAHNKVVPLGITDYVFIPAGTSLTNVPLPTDEKKSYTVITPKDGFWVSKDGFNRLESMK
jgi:hypothetical protein